MDVQQARAIYDAYVKFAKADLKAHGGDMKKANAIARFVEGAGTHEVSAATGDSIHKFWRSGAELAANRTARDKFEEALSVLLKDKNIPQHVKDRMTNFQTGHPLSARRILLIDQQMELVMAGKKDSGETSKVFGDLIKGLQDNFDAKQSIEPRSRLANMRQTVRAALDNIKGLFAQLTGVNDTVRQGVLEAFDGLLGELAKEIPADADPYDGIKTTVADKLKAGIDKLDAMLNDKSVKSGTFAPGTAACSFVNSAKTLLNELKTEIDDRADKFNVDVLAAQVNGLKGKLAGFEDLLNHVAGRIQDGPSQLEISDKKVWADRLRTLLTEDSLKGLADNVDNAFKNLPGAKELLDGYDGNAADRDKTFGDAKAALRKRQLQDSVDGYLKNGKWPQLNELKLEDDLYELCAETVKNELKDEIVQIGVDIDNAVNKLDQQVKDAEKELTRKSDDIRSRKQAFSEKDVKEYAELSGKVKLAENEVRTAKTKCDSELNARQEQLGQLEQSRDEVKGRRDVARNQVQKLTAELNTIKKSIDETQLSVNSRGKALAELNTNLGRIDEKGSRLNKSKFSFGGFIKGLVGKKELLSPELKILLQENPGQNLEEDYRRLFGKPAGKNLDQGDLAALRRLKDFASGLERSIDEKKSFNAKQAIGMSGKTDELLKAGAELNALEGELTTGENCVAAYKDESAKIKEQHDTTVSDLQLKLAERKKDLTDAFGDNEKFNVLNDLDSIRKEEELLNADRANLTALQQQLSQAERMKELFKNVNIQVMQGLEQKDVGIGECRKALQTVRSFKSTGPDGSYRPEDLAKISTKQAEDVQLKGRFAGRPIDMAKHVLRNLSVELRTYIDNVPETGLGKGDDGKTRKTLLLTKFDDAFGKESLATGGVDKLPPNLKAELTEKATDERAVRRICNRFVREIVELAKNSKYDLENGFDLQNEQTLNAYSVKRLVEVEVKEIAELVKDDSVCERICALFADPKKSLGFIDAWRNVKYSYRDVQYDNKVYTEAYNQALLKTLKDTKLSEDKNCLTRLNEIIGELASTIAIPEEKVGYFDDLRIEFSRIVTSVTDAATKLAYKNALQKFNELDQKLIDALPSDRRTMNVEKMKALYAEFCGISVEEFNALPDERKLQLAKFIEPISALSVFTEGYYTEFCREIATGRFPFDSVPEETLKLVMDISHIKTKSEIDKSYTTNELAAGGFGTNSPTEILHGLALEGLHNLQKGDRRAKPALIPKEGGKTERCDMDFHETLCTLWSLNGNRVGGLTQLCHRIFKKEINAVTKADIMSVVTAINKNRKNGKPDLTGIDPLLAFKGNALEVYDFLVQKGSMPSQWKDFGWQEAQNLIARLKTIADNRGGESVSMTIHGTPATFSFSAAGSLSLRLGKAGTEVWVETNPMALAERLVEDVLLHPSKFGAENARKLLLPPGEPGARDRALTVVASRFNVRLSDLGHIPTAQLVAYAKALLGDPSGIAPGQTPEAAVKALIDGAKNVRMNSEEIIDALGALETAEADKNNPVENRVKISLPKEPPRVIPPEREQVQRLNDFAADLLMDLQTVDYDRAGDGVERLKSVLKANASVLRELVGLQGDELSNLTVEMNVGGLGEVITEIVKTLTDAGVNAGNFPNDIIAKFNAETVSALATKVNAAVTKAAGEAQKLFTESFVDKLNVADENVQIDVKMMSLSELGDSEALNKNGGYGKFLIKSFKAYFNGSKPVEQRRMVAALLRSGTAKTDTVGRLSALVKAAGPVFVKLLQGLPMAVVPPELQPVMDDLKDNMPPIDERTVKAQLLDMVNRSNGQITSIEVVGRLGAASVGEALLCRIKTPGNEAGEECVVKLLRPDVQNRSKREREFFLEQADESMKKTFQGRLDRIFDEMDLTVEGKNIKMGVAYGSNENDKEGTVSGIKTHVALRPTGMSLVMQKAPGQTAEKLIKSRNKELDEIERRLRTSVEEQGGTKRVAYRVNTLGEYIGVVQSLKTKHQILSNAYEKVLTLSKRWTNAAFFGKPTCFFHGDLHAGNVMISGEQLSAIDFGNAPTMTNAERKDLGSMVLYTSMGNAPLLCDVLMDHVPEEFKSELEGKGALAKEIGQILSKGMASDVVPRMQAVVQAMLRHQVPVPPFLFNFSQAAQRFANLADEMLATIRRCERMIQSVEIAPLDESEARKVNNESNWKDSPEIVLNYGSIYRGLSKPEDILKQMVKIRKTGGEEWYVEGLPDQVAKVMREQAKTPEGRNLLIEVLKQNVDVVYYSPGMTKTSTSKMFGKICLEMIDMLKDERRIANENDFAVKLMEFGNSVGLMNAALGDAYYHLRTFKPAQLKTFSESVASTIISHSISELKSLIPTFHIVGHWGEIQDGAGTVFDMVFSGVDRRASIQKATSAYKSKHPEMTVREFETVIGATKKFVNFPKSSEYLNTKKKITNWAQSEQGRTDMAAALKRNIDILLADINRMVKDERLENDLEAIQKRAVELAMIEFGCTFGSFTLFKAAVGTDFDSFLTSLGDDKVGKLAKEAANYLHTTKEDELSVGYVDDSNYQPNQEELVVLAEVVGLNAK